MHERGFLAALRFYRGHFRAVFVLSLAFYAAIYALVAVAFAELDAFSATLAAVYIITVSIFWQQAPLARLLDDARARRTQAGVRRTFETLYPRIGAITGATALAAIAIFVAYSLFVLPGLFLAARWSLIVPVVVLEGKGAFAALARSNRLVRGHTWRVAGEFLISAIAMIVVWSFAAGLVGGGGTWFGGAMAILTLALVTPPIPLMRISSYYDLAATSDAVPGTNPALS